MTPYWILISSSSRRYVNRNHDRKLKTIKNTINRQVTIIVRGNERSPKTTKTRKGMVNSLSNFSSVITADIGCNLAALDILISHPCQFGYVYPEFLRFFNLQGWNFMNSGCS